MTGVRSLLFIGTLLLWYSPEVSADGHMATPRHAFIGITCSWNIPDGSASFVCTGSSVLKSDTALKGTMNLDPGVSCYWMAFELDEAPTKNDARCSWNVNANGVVSYERADYLFPGYAEYLNESASDAITTRAPPMNTTRTTSPGSNPSPSTPSRPPRTPSPGTTHQPPRTPSHGTTRRPTISPSTSTSRPGVSPSTTTTTTQRTTTSSATTQTTTTRPPTTTTTTPPTTTTTPPPTTTSTSTTTTTPPPTTSTSTTTTTPPPTTTTTMTTTTTTPPTTTTTPSTTTSPSPPPITDGGNLISVLPWTCGFETDMCGIAQDTNDNFNWTRNTFDTPSDLTGPWGAKTGLYYMYVEASRRNNQDMARLFLPPIARSGTYCFVLRYHMYGFHIDTLAVGILHSTGVYEILWTLQGDQGNFWHEGDITMDLTENDQVAITGTVGAAYSGDIAIDDLVLFSGSC